MCTLRPGVIGLSENITVTSILGRFLEHSRIYEFNNDSNPIVLVGSADLMNRNLDRRVEVLVPIPTLRHQKRLSELLDLGLAPSTSAWHLNSEGLWNLVTTSLSGEKLSDYQETLIGQYELRGGK
jgi:polyphosphate kinase